MFAIEARQMEVFTKQSEDEFLDRLVDFVRQDFPRKFRRVGAETVRKSVRRSVETAREYGFDTERQIASWVDLGLRYGKVWQEPWAQPHLERDSGPADRRMRSLQLATLQMVGEIKR